jgi:hypothetical protein
MGSVMLVGQISAVENTPGKGIGCNCVGNNAVMVVYKKLNTSGIRRFDKCCDYAYMSVRKLSYCIQSTTTYIQIDLTKEQTSKHVLASTDLSLTQTLCNVKQHWCNCWMRHVGCGENARDD